MLRFFPQFFPIFAPQVRLLTQARACQKHAIIMKKLLLFLLLGLSLQAQDLRVEPLNWWVGMKNPKLQLLIHGKDLQGSDVIASKPGLKVLKVHQADSPNYLFVDCEVASNAVAGTYPLDIKKGNKVIHHIDYKLESRTPNSANRPSYSTKDVIYTVNRIPRVMKCTVGMVGT
jgi:hypothetical protein